MFSSESTIRVRYAETDQMGVVYHSRFFEYFEVARADSVRSLGFTYADMERMGIIMPVIEAHAMFLRPGKYDDLLTIKTILKELPSRHKIEFHHQVFNEKGEHLVDGRIVLFFMDGKTMRKTRMPEEMIEKLKPFFK